MEIGIARAARVETRTGTNAAWGARRKVEHTFDTKTRGGCIQALSTSRGITQRLEMGARTRAKEERVRIRARRIKVKVRGIKEKARAKRPNQKVIGSVLMINAEQYAGPEEIVAFAAERSDAQTGSGSGETGSVTEALVSS